MTLVFFTEARFTRAQNGIIYSLDENFSHKLWERYLADFSKLIIVARVIDSDKNDFDEKYISSSDKVSFLNLPYYIGPLQYLKVKNSINYLIESTIKPNRSYLCRVPGQIGTIAAKFLYKKKIPYGVEVVGDPWDVFAPNSIKHPLRVFFRYIGFYNLKKIVRNANIALYVTKYTLQKRYPISKNRHYTYASDVQIKKVNTPIKVKYITSKKEYNLISIGSLEQMYKSPDIVLRSIKILNEANINCNLYWLGDGKLKDEMILLSKNLKIDKLVTFLGNVSAEKVRYYLSISDIFILASRTEGLPRALVEAMSQGLPCIGTNVGGIPELLDKDVLIKKNDVNELTNKICFMISNIDFTNQQAKINFEKSKEFNYDILTLKRRQFYKELIKVSKK